MNKIISFFLVIYPILNIYCLPGLDIFPVGYIFSIIIFSVVLLKKSKINYKLPDGFKPFWLYVAIIYIAFAPSFGIGLFIPGGYSFFMWVILFWLCNNYLDYGSFIKYYRVIFICCSVAFLIQEISYFTIGNRPLLMLPLPFYGVDKAIIMNNQMALDRSSCFFLEPSHFAQFIIPLLAIEIFGNSKNKIVNGFSVLIMLILLLLRSGTGMLGMAILMLIRVLTYFKQSKWKYKLMLIFIFIPVASFLTYKYLSSEVGSVIAERASGLGLSEDAESSIRTVHGYLLYSTLPVINKIFGLHITDVANFAMSSKFAYLFISKNTGDIGVYLNGFQHILVTTGLIGILLFLRVWFKLYIENDLLSKSLIWVFIVLLFICNQYLGPMMLICMLLPYKNKSQSNIIINEGV